jgi:hypothetical protein
VLVKLGVSCTAGGLYLDVGACLLPRLCGLWGDGVGRGLRAHPCPLFRS